MASLFYNRYIPPAAPQAVAGYGVESEQRSRKQKERSNGKRARGSPEKPDQEDQLPNNVGASEPADAAVIDSLEPEELPKKRKKTKSSAQVPDLTPTEQDLKHEKIRSKYKKAVKASEEPLNQPNGTSTGSFNGVVKEASSTPPPQSHGLTPIPQPAYRPQDSKVSLSSALPGWLRNPTKTKSDTNTSFADLDLSSKTLEALRRKGFKDALPIQAALLPMLLPTPSRYKGDICISAATGSGKTLAYALPMVENLRGKPLRLLRGLVVVPTRELVVQARETFALCCHGTGLIIGTAIGNRSLKEEQELLIAKGERYDPFTFAAQEFAKEEEGIDELLDLDYDPTHDLDDEAALLPGYVVDYTSKIDILICTPGRLVEHIRTTKGFTLQHVQWLVVDEADRLLEESFQQWVDTVVPELEYLPPLDKTVTLVHQNFRILRRREVRKILLSATMTRDISKLLALRLSNPRMVVLEPANRDGIDATGDELTDDGANFTIPQTLTELAVPVEDASDKPLYLIEILENGVQLPQTFPHKGQKPTETQSSKHNHKSEVETTSSSEAEGHETSSSSSLTSSSSSPASPLHSSSSPTHQSRSPPPPTTTNPIPPHGTLLFTSSTTSATRLTYLLHTLLPHLTSQIHNLTKHTTPKSRRKALSSFHKHPHPPPSPPSYPPLPPIHRNSYLPLLITTSRSSLGLSIPHLAHVISYDIPPSLKSYIHRVGRTARAGAEGTAITLVEPQQGRWFWNEVARNPRLRRGKGERGETRKVIRGRLVGDGMGKWREEGGGEWRKRYERALGELGEAVRGEGRDRRK